MKKRLIIFFCGVMCLFLLLCSCEDEGTDSSGSSSSVGSSSSDTSSLTPSTTPGGDGNHDHTDPDVSSPETPCELNSLGHYWSNVSLNKNTSSTGTIAISGKCHLCGDSLYKVCTTLVDYNEWKSALSQDNLSSFTEISGNEYLDYDTNNSISWRINNGTYTCDYFIKSETKNSRICAQKFEGFSLLYNKFKYDDNSKTYVYWLTDKSYVELGFADGKLLSHSVVSSNDKETTKTTTLYLNHQRIAIKVDDFIPEKFDSALSMDALLKSNLSSSLAEKIYDELTKLDFDLSFEASLLEKDTLSIYFYLDSPENNPLSDSTYTEATVIIIDNKIVKVSFGSSTVDIKY